jgi:hypothetical protein
VYSVTAYVVNDLISSSAALNAHVTVTLEPWSTATGQTSKVVASVEVSAVAGASTLAVHAFLPADDSKLQAMYGCSVSSCFLKATATVTSGLPEDAVVYPHYTWLTPIKNANLDSNNFNIEITNITQSSHNTFAFTVTSSQTAPFLWLDLDTQALKLPASAGQGLSTYGGWFSDNNFVAEANVNYVLTYTAFHNTNKETVYPQLTLDVFSSSLRARALQSLYSC